MCYCESRFKDIDFLMSTSLRYRYILFHKPYGVLSQFTAPVDRKCLRDFGPFPADVYPVGRLDADSEGLLLLTNNNRVKHRLANPAFAHSKTYLIQVEGIPDDDALQRLRDGIRIGGRMTRKAGVERCKDEPEREGRSVPIRFRKTVPTSWLEMTIHEGRNRQVRKMSAAVGHPTLRLVRVRIGFLSLTGLRQGEFRDLTSVERRRLLSEL